MSIDKIFSKEWNIFPLKKNEKAPPLFKEWQTKRFPRKQLEGHDGNHALGTGDVSGGIVVFDWDFRRGFERKENGLDEIYPEFKKEFPKLASTLVCQTPHGFHFYYKLKGEKYRNTSLTNGGYDKKGFVGKNELRFGKWLMGLDTRANGGYVVVPPSVVNGVKYEWAMEDPIVEITDSEYEAVFKWFKVKEKETSSTTMRQGFVDIFNGKINPNEFKAKTGLDEHVYWKEAFHEAHSCCGVLPEDLLEGLQKFQPGFDLEETIKQLKNDKVREYILNGKRLTSEKYSEYFQISKEKKKEIEVIEVIEPQSNPNQIVLDLKNKQSERQIAEITLIALKDYDIKTIKETGEICYSNNGVYKKSDETNSLILSTIDDIAKRAVCFVRFDKNGNPIYKPYQMGIGKQNDIVNKIQIQTFCSLKEFEQNDDLIFCNNGVYNLRENPANFIPSESIKEHFKDFDHFKTFHKLEWDYDKEAKCPLIEKALVEILGLEELVKEYYKMLAYFLMNHIKYQKAFMFFGPPSCGKTTLIELALIFVAGRNARESKRYIRNISIQDLQKPFRLVELKDALINYFDDLDPELEENLSMFRIVTTNEVIGAAMKHIQGDIFWKNRTKLLFGTNELIDFKKDPGDQFWRRWVMFELYNIFKNKEDMTEEEKEDPFVHEKDVDLKDKMYVREEMSGLLNKVINEYITLEKEKRFNPKIDNIERIKSIWLMNLNPLKLFMDECCEVNIKDKNTKIEVKSFVKAVNKFRKERNFSEISQSLITRRLKVLGIKRVDTKKIEPNRFVYQGISLKPEVIETDIKDLKTEFEQKVIDEYNKKEIPAKDEFSVFDKVFLKK